MLTPVNYEYMTDNIMDWAHRVSAQGLIGQRGGASRQGGDAQDGTTVYSGRLTNNEILPGPLDALYETAGKPVDRWLDVALGCAGAHAAGGRRDSDRVAGAYRPRNSRRAFDDAGDRNLRRITSGQCPRLSP